MSDNVLWTLGTLARLVAASSEDDLWGVEVQLQVVLGVLREGGRQYEIVREMQRLVSYARQAQRKQKHETV